MSVDTIRKHLDKAELLTQLAEEAAELAQAALKLRRVYTGKNTTPVTEKEALDNLVEEMADVSVCLRVLNIDTPEITAKCKQIMNKKLERWAARLEGGTEDG